MTKYTYVNKQWLAEFLAKTVGDKIYDLYKYKFDYNNFYEDIYSFMKKSYISEATNSTNFFGRIYTDIKCYDMFADWFYNPDNFQPEIRIAYINVDRYKRIIKVPLGKYGGECIC